MKQAGSHSPKKSGLEPQLERHVELLQAVTQVEDIVYTLDRQQRHVGVFGRWLEKYGLQAEQFLGKTASDALGAEAAVVHEAANRRALAGEHVVYEWSAETPHGTLYVQTSLSPIRDASGEIVGIIGVGRDITERKRMEEALREREDRYRDLVEHSQDLICTHDLEGRILSANQAAIKLLGYDPNDFIGKKSVRDILAPEVRDQFDAYLATIRKEGVARGMMVVQTSAGERRIWEYNNTLRTEGVAAPVVRGMAHDITERWRAEKALRQSHQHLTRIYDIVTRYQGQELFDQAAAALAELLGMAYVFICELEEKSDSVRVLASHSPKGIPAGTRYDMTSTPCELVIRNRSVYAYPQGVHKLFPADTDLTAWRIESYLAAPITDSRGEVLGIVNAFDERPKEFTETEEQILRIVSQRVGAEIVRLRQEEAQRRLQEQLFEAQKMESVGTLAGGVAHEFNNLLTGIMGFTEMALLKLGRHHELAGHLNHVLSLSGRARDLVRQMLLFSRPTIGEKRRCNLHEFLNDLALLLRRTIPREVEIQLVLAADEIFVEANPLQLQQMLINIAVNARDAMPAGGQLRIETRLTQVTEGIRLAHRNVKPGPFVRLTVSDTGEGIAPQVQTHIFEPFFTTKEVGKGTGLGLSVVYGIVKAHGGWIEVQSEVGRGASFHIYLPVAERKVERAPAESDEKIVGGGETILLVEDEPMVLELGQTVLQTLGYHVLTAQDGERAIETYTLHRDVVDLVVLDVVMPQMSGYRAFAELRRLNPQVKILLVTGYSPEEVAEELLQQGAEGVVQKPYDMKTLASLVRRSLDSGAVQPCSS